jgi:hypothetical protein
MAKRFNSAARIHTLLKPYVTRADQQAIVVWKEMFGVTEQQTNKAFLSISGRLSTLHEELELVRTGMETTEFSAHLYADMLIGVEKGISVEILHANWGSAVQYFKPEFMRALDFCSEILPDEMQQLSESDVHEVLKIIDELKAELNTTNLPESLSSLIRKHIILIERAIFDYQIQGYRAVENVVTLMTGDIVTQGQMIKANNDKPVVTTLRRLYEKVTNVGDKVRPMIDMFNSIAGFIENVT